MYMRKPKGMIMRLIYAGIAFACATFAFADTVTLKSGRVINGTYLGGTARTIRVEIGDNIESFDVSDVSRIEFRGTAASSPVRDEEQRPTLRRSDGGSTRPPDNPGILRPE